MTMTIYKRNPLKLIGKGVIDLLQPSDSYDVERYGWAYDCWKRQQQIHWMAEEVPMGEDIINWKTDLKEKEVNLLSHIFRLFTQSDIEVANNYMRHYLNVFQPLELQMMLVSFANMETVHVEAYALLLKTLGIQASEFSAFKEYKEMQKKIDFLHLFNIKTCEDVSLTLAAFGAFTEGLSLFASFAMLLNFPRNNKMKGMGQIISWSVRDESLHCEGIIRLFHEWIGQTGGLTTQTAIRITGIAATVVELEDKFIDLAFEMGDLENLTAQDVKNYIRYIADWRLTQLKLDPIYGYFSKFANSDQYVQVLDHPLPWLVAILNGVEHANFFETRATEYSKVTTVGEWHGDKGTWAVFDNQRDRGGLYGKEK